jgi:tRNA nucleotidyltransferase (CCA-adding enzyme)
MKFKIPKEIKNVGAMLQSAGFEAYLVGGCVRDLILGNEPKDWDIATNAKPEEIQNIFPESVYKNNFGTVAVKTDSEDLKLKIVEITTFRLEGKYSDKRHPDEIKFAKNIHEDLSRRDFTINALALNLEGDGEIIDPYGGREDLKNKVLKTVGDPEARFTEDALRLMRAVRFATEFDLQIEFETRRAILKHAGLLEAIAKERVRDELIKILMTQRAAQGIILLEELDLLRYVIPELREGLGMTQNLHHIYTVFEHNVRSLDYSASKDHPLLVRVAALLHDVGKPKTKAGDGPNSTFYNHEIVGAKMTLKILDNLHFPKDFIEKAAHLVRNHMFYYNVDEVTEAGVRRFLKRVSPENLEDLFKLREADRIGSGVPKAFPYKLRHLQFMIEKVKNDPISPKMLKVSGEDVMEIAQIQPGPKVGWILNILLEEVIEDPKLNERDMLEKRIHELAELSEKELQKLSEKAKETKYEAQGGIEEEMKKKFFVK